MSYRRCSAARLIAWLAMLPASLAAQQAPYDVFPAADPPYYRVRYEAAEQPGELQFAVNYTIWIPSGVEQLRGVIVHQHGCGEGSCKSGLTGAFDLHWQALARKHGCALLSPAYEQPEGADCQRWCDPRNGSDTAFRRCLVELGTKSGHPELAAVPWALWGHSGGGHWAGGMVLLHPRRVIAAWLRSGVPLLKPNPDRPTIKAHALPDAALTVPLMCNLGTKEGVTVKEGRFAAVWPANEAFFSEVRGRGGLIGVAVDPLTSHECGNQRYLAIPWLDACLTARLPRGNDEPLRPMRTDSAWLAHPTGFEAVPAAKYDGAALQAAWLPNEAIAEAWMQYVKDTGVADKSPPPAPTNVRVVGTAIHFAVEADLESGLASFIIERDGRFLANLPERGKNPFGRPVFQNLQYSDTPTQPLVPLQFIDAQAEPGKQHTYRVIAVNTAGLQSQPSEAIGAASEILPTTAQTFEIDGHKAFPSRTALFSGVRPWQSGLYDNGLDIGPSVALRNATPLPKVLQSAGYYTASYGKVGHGWDLRKVWDDYMPHRRDPNPPGAPFLPFTRGEQDWGPTHLAEEEMNDSKYADAAIAQLAKKHDRPFLVACGLFHPHMPWYVPQKYFDMFPLEAVALPPILANDLSDVPALGQALTKGKAKFVDQLMEHGAHKEGVRAYLAATAYADAQVGRVLNALEKSEYRDNTIVMLMSDHGFHLGEKHHWQKSTLWEVATHCLLMFRAPGTTKAGGQCERFVSLQDVYPTLAELCGLEAPDDVTGRSLVPLLEQPAAAWESTAITAFGDRYITIRNEQFRYIRYRDGQEEFYDCANDPHEWTNHILNPAFASAIDGLRSKVPPLNEMVPELKRARGGLSDE